MELKSKLGKTGKDSILSAPTTSNRKYGELINNKDPQSILIWLEKELKVNKKLRLKFEQDFASVSRMMTAGELNKKHEEIKNV